MSVWMETTHFGDNRHGVDTDLPRFRRQQPALAIAFRHDSI